MASLGSKLRFLITAGVGFFADGYLNLTIGLGMNHDYRRSFQY